MGGGLTSCPICCAASPVAFAEIRNSPVCIGQLFANKQEAQEAATGTICLGFCEACGHVANTAYNAKLLSYGEQYENSLEFATTFRSYAENLAEKLVKKYDLRNKDVLEIGCGNGYFLKRLCAVGDNRGVGYDPAAPAQNEAKITFVRDVFSALSSDVFADLVCCRQTLEHFEQPRMFLLDLQRASSDPSKLSSSSKCPTVISSFGKSGM